MIDFKEKVRKEAADILESKEELNEAELKEFLGFSKAERDEKREAQARYYYVELLMNRLSTLIAAAQEIKEHNQYFNKKGLTAEEAHNFYGALQKLNSKFGEVSGLMTNIVNACGKMLQPYFTDELKLNKGRRR